MRRGGRVRCRHLQCGQGTVEFVIIFALFAALLMGLFEMTRVFRIKHMLNEATFSAARAGALNNARVEPMTAELANRMARAYIHGESAAALTAAIDEARLYMQALQAAGRGVRIVSPTRAIFDQLKKRQWLRLDGDNRHRFHYVIPNDNLRWRPRRTASVQGGKAEINLQDANLLKIRTLWCHRLMVPGLDRVIYAVVNALAPSERQNVCNTISATSQTLGLAPGWYLAISADATIRMQTPVVRNNLP